MMDYSSERLSHISKVTQSNSGKAEIQPQEDTAGTDEPEKKVKVKSLSCVRLFVTPWTVANQASWSMGFSRQEYQIGLPFPSPGDLLDPGIEHGSPALQADALPSEPGHP